VYLVGQILDLVEPGAAHRSVTAFRWAFVAVVVITAIGIQRMITWWLRTRAEVLLAAARGEDVPVPVRAHRWELVDAVLLAQEAERARQAALAEVAASGDPAGAGPAAGDETDAGAPGSGAPGGPAAPDDATDHQ